MIKLKSKDISEVRARLLQEQNGICSLCNESITEGAVLDHDHGTGLIRSTLHRSCNAAEGRVISVLKRQGIKDIPGFLENLNKYWLKHATDQHQLIHPSFRTVLEKKEATKRRAKKRALEVKSRGKTSA